MTQICWIADDFQRKGDIAPQKRQPSRKLLA
jgi:hypothetical protein